MIYYPKKYQLFLVTSKTKYNADPTDSIDIVDKLLLTYNNSRDNVETNINLLKEFTDETINVWVAFFK